VTGVQTCALPICHEAHINSENANVVGAAAHDVLHFAGMKDKYQDAGTNSKGDRPILIEPGYTKSNIMADRSGTDLKVDQFREAQANRTTKRCSNENGTTTCK
jgi:hypothetical protein